MILVPLESIFSEVSFLVIILVFLVRARYRKTWKSVCYCSVFAEILSLSAKVFQTLRGSPISLQNLRAYEGPDFTQNSKSISTVDPVLLSARQQRSDKWIQKKSMSKCVLKPIKWLYRMKRRKYTRTNSKESLSSLSASDHSGRSTTEMERAKTEFETKNFWSDQLRKAHNMKDMTYKRFDGSGKGTVGKQLL